MAYDTRKLKYCGKDVLISDEVVIRYPELVSIGHHVAIDSFVHISTALDIGSYVHIGPMVSIIGGKQAKLVMRDFTGIAAGCRIICSSDDFLGTGLTNPMVPDAYHANVYATTIVMEKHSLLGTNCVVHPSVRISEGAAVGSCSVVKRDLDPWTIYSGNPAVAIGPRSKKRILKLEAKLWAELPEN